MDGSLDRFKYRVFDHNENKYIRDPYLTLNYNGELVGISRAGEVVDVPEELKFTIEQCTGLKDKNGKLIYEGDILYSERHEVSIIVEFDNDDLCYIFREDIFLVWDWSLLRKYGLPEIIGNMFENKELLK